MKHDYAAALKEMPSPWNGGENETTQSFRVRSFSWIGNHYFAIRSALTEMQRIQDEGDGWRTMDSAPRDGTPFIIWCEQTGLQNNKSRHLITKVKDGLYEGLMFFDEPTHWRPLPAPPRGEE